MNDDWMDLLKWITEGLSLFFFFCSSNVLSLIKWENMKRLWLNLPLIYFQYFGVVVVAAAVQRYLNLHNITTPIKNNSLKMRKRHSHKEKRFASKRIKYESTWLFFFVFLYNFFFLQVRVYVPKSRESNFPELGHYDVNGVTSE